MSYIQEAWSKVVENPKEAKAFYVCLMETIPYYAGSEEGGTYGSDTVVVEYKLCATEEEAEALAKAVRKMAKELTEEEKRSYGNHCLNQMEWCDNRGLDYDYLPENDGPSEFSVIVCEDLPQNHYGSRHYE